MVIKRITNFGQKVFKDLNWLLLQLSSVGYQMKENRLKEVIKNKNNYLFAMYDRNLIIGTITLIKISQIRRSKGLIEDFVIDQRYRGRGLGKKLMLHTIAVAKKLQLSQLVLTSESYRITANKLYKKLGFKIKEINFYYLDGKL